MYFKHEKLRNQTTTEVIRAQEAWVDAVIAQDVETLLALYDFGSQDEPLLFADTGGCYSPR